MYMDFGLAKFSVMLSCVIFYNLATLLRRDQCSNHCSISPDVRCEALIYYAKFLSKILLMKKR